MSFCENKPRAHMYNDLTLVEGLKRNSLEAYNQLVSRYGQMIFVMIARIVPDVRDAQELTQDALLDAIRKIHQFDPRLSQLSTWLGSIAYNNARNFMRRSKEVTVSLEESETELYDIDEGDIGDMSSGNEEQIAMLQQVVVTLPPDERLLLSLYYFDSVPLSDIAQMMGSNPRTLSKRLYNIRKKLYNRLK